MESFKWQARIYYEDTDAGGVVFYARYLALLERARTEMLRACGIEQKVLLAENIAFVVRQVNIQYLAPAYLDDFLTITTHLKTTKKASLVFEQQITNQKGQHLNTAEVVIVCVDLQRMKPRAFPDSVLTQFL